MIADQTVANTVIARVGAGGYVSLFNETGTSHVIADVQGWFPSTEPIPPALGDDIRVLTDLPSNDPQLVAFRCGIVAGQRDGRITSSVPITLAMFDDRERLAEEYSEVGGNSMEVSRKVFESSEAVAMYNGWIFANPSLANERRVVDPAHWFKGGAHEWFHVASFSYLFGPEGFDRPHELSNHGQGAYGDRLRFEGVRYGVPLYPGLHEWEDFSGSQVNYELLPTIADHLIARSGGTEPLLLGWWKERGAGRESEPWPVTFERVFGMSRDSFYRSTQIYLDSLSR